jgi:hypothetical protein
MGIQMTKHAKLRSANRFGIAALKELDFGPFASEPAKTLAEVRDDARLKSVLSRAVLRDAAPPQLKDSIRSMIRG